MVSSSLTGPAIAVQKGRAMVDAAEVLKNQNIRVTMNGISTRLEKVGLYEFDANQNVVRVFDGKAVVDTPQKKVDLSRDHELALNNAAKPKSQKFDKNAYADDFYNWGSMRSSYLAEANIDEARRYAGATGYAPTMWAGPGWYWDPWYTAYTWLPGDGIFYDPFGWGFYSPWMVWGAPYWGYGFGGYGYWGGYHHFGPGYRPPAAMAAVHSQVGAGRAFSLRGPAAVSAMRGGFSGGGYRGFAAESGFAGRGFGGRGFGGGGFHGGGGRR